jgi:hypothetical protein
MVRIAERVWTAWREQAEQFDEPSLLLLFSPAGGGDSDARHAVREAVLEVQDALEAKAATSGNPDPPFVGEWDWVPVTEGVLVQVVECELFEDMLPAVAAALERRGVDGTFDLRERPVVATPPRVAHFLECRLRVGGERVRREPRSYRWHPDPDAHARVLAAAEQWCRRDGRGARESLTSGTIAPVPVEPGEDVLERMREDVADGIYVSLSAVAADEFRSIGARAWVGGVSLVVGGAWVESGQWRRPLAELTSMLGDHADLLAYGYVRRGWYVTEALLGDSLPFDWPHRADHQPHAAGFTAQAFDDVYAPDAFGVQLLGAGYAGRVREDIAWRAQPAASDAVLLEHVDVSAWFEAPFIPFRERPRRPDQVPVPAVLAEAREALAPILYSPGVLDRDGYTDAEGL